MTLPLCVSSHCCHYVGRETTSGIFSTNIYSALTRCQKLKIRLLTITTKNITVPGFTELLVQGIQNGDRYFCNPSKLQGSNLQVKDFQGYCLLSSPKQHPTLNYGIYLSKVSIFLLFRSYITKNGKYILGSVRDFGN